MTILTIAANNLRRLVRVRENLFFVFALPLLLIVTLGLSLTSITPRLGIHVEGERTPAIDELVRRFEALDGADAIVFDDLEAATEELKREDLVGLVVVPAAYGDLLDSGGTAEVQFLSIPSTDGLEGQGFVQSAVADQNAADRAARVVVDQAGVGVDEATALVVATDERLAELTVTTVDPAGEPFIPADGLGFVAAQQLVLFMFLIAMTAAAVLIEVRRLGVARRMLATPATTAEVVAGEALGRYGTSVVQAAFIVVATALLFGLDWGSWPAMLAIVAAFALVSTAAALLVGSLARNESQSTAIGISLGLAMAALGGSMVPLEVFPDGLRRVAHVTPHAWAVDAFTGVIMRGGGLGDVLVELAVLVGYGAALLAAGTFALRRSIVG